MVVSVGLEGWGILTKGIFNNALKSIVRARCVTAWFLEAMVGVVAWISPASKDDYVVCKSVSIAVRVRQSLHTLHVEEDISWFEFAFGNLTGHMRQGEGCVSVGKAPAITHKTTTKQLKKVHITKLLPTHCNRNERRSNRGSVHSIPEVHCIGNMESSYRPTPLLFWSLQIAL